MKTSSFLQTEFIGRDNEFTIIRNELKSSETLIVCVHGIAGIGKTWLLRRTFSLLSNNGACCALCDLSSYGSLDYLFFLTILRNQFDGSFFKDFDQSVAELQRRLIELYQPLIAANGMISINVQGNTFQGNVGDIVGIKIDNLTVSIPKSEVERLYKEMQGKITGSFILGLQNLVQFKPVIILVDSYEKIENPTQDFTTDLSLWIERELLSSLKENAKNLLFVLARREPLTWMTRNREWKNSISQHKIPYFSEFEILNYLKLREIQLSPELEGYVVTITHGHPQILALIMDLLTEFGANVTLDILGNLPNQLTIELDEKIISEYLLESILSRMPLELSTLISRLAIPHWFDAATIQAFSNNNLEECIVLIEKLQRYSFVKKGKSSSYLFHDVIRTLLYKRLQVRSHSEFVRLHGIAHDYFRLRLENLPIHAQQEIQLEALYHLIPLDEDLAISQASEFFERFDHLYEWDNARYLINIMMEHSFQSERNKCWVAYYQIRLLERDHQWYKVREAYNRILNEAVVDELLRAKICSNLGRAHWLLDEPEEAIASYRTSADLYSALQDISEYAWNIRNIAKIYSKHFRFEDALIYCNECLEIFEKSKDQYKIGWIYKTIGEIYKRRGDFHLAEVTLEKSLQIWKELGYDYGLVDTLSALSDVYRFSGNLVTARNAYQKINNLYKKLNDDHGIGWSWHGIGEILRMQGQFQEASQFTKLSLTHFSNMHYKFGMAWNARSLGEIARMQGLYEVALGHYKNSEDLFIQCGDPQGKTWIMQSLGEVYLGQGNYLDAKEALLFVKAKLERVGDYYMLARTFRSLANLNCDLGDYSQSIKNIREAIKISLHEKNRYQQAICILNLSRILLMTGRNEIAHHILIKPINEFVKQEDYYHLLQAQLLLWRITENATIKSIAENFGMTHHLEWLFDPANPSYARKFAFG